MTSLPLALSRADVADYVQTLITVYLILIFIRVLISWIRSIPYNRWLNAFLTLVHDVTNPYLNLFRRITPMARIGPGAIDLSPMVAMLVLVIVGGFVVAAING